MIKRASLFLIAAVLLSGCKHSSFLKQRYTHFGHSRPATCNTAKAVGNEPVRTAQSPPILKESVVRRTTGPEAAREQRTMPPQRPASRRGQTRSQSYGALCSAQPARPDYQEQKKIRMVPEKIRQSVTETASGIPVISPLLRLVLLILLIILVALLILALV